MKSDAKERLRKLWHQMPLDREQKEVMVEKLIATITPEEAEKMAMGIEEIIGMLPVLKDAEDALIRAIEASNKRWLKEQAAKNKK